MSDLNAKAEIKPYTKKELAILYEVSTRCFSTMIKPFEAEVGRKSGWYFNVNQVNTIFDKLGFPGVFLKDALS